MSDNEGGGLRPEISRRIRGLSPGGRVTRVEVPTEDEPAEDGPAEGAEAGTPTASDAEDASAPTLPPARALGQAPTLAAARAPTPTPAPVPAPAASGGGDDSRALVVGADIVLSGAISSCDKLVVDGRVEADLKESREIIIGQGGVFKGSAEIEVATIGGLFEGSLVVRGQLVVRAGGRIQGEVRYSQLAVEPGGVIVGNMNTLDG